MYRFIFCNTIAEADYFRKVQEMRIKKDSTKRRTENRENITGEKAG